MFESVCDEGAPSVGASFEEDWFDPAWLDEIPYDYRTDPLGRTHPSPAQPEPDQPGWCAGAPPDDDLPPF